MAQADPKDADDRRWPVRTTNQQLIDAAGTVIARRGSEFSMSEVAAEASVSRPTLYRYFPTRSDVLHAVATDGWTRFAAGLEAATNDVPRAERLERALDYVGDFQKTLPRYVIDVAPGFAIERLAEALPHMRASVLGLLGNCFGVSALFGPSPEACHDIADRIVRTAMSHFLLPSETADGLAKALRAAAGLPPPLTGSRPRGGDIVDNSGSVHMELRPLDASVALQSLHEDGVALRDAVLGSPEAAVLSCPGWTSRDLLGHTSGAHRWVTQVVSTGAVPQFRALPEPPKAFSDLVIWYTAGLEDLEAVLGGTDPDFPVWTPTAGVVGSMWWRRKVAVETALHRWDAQNALTALGGAPPELLRAPIAVAGVDEYVTEFLPGMLAVAGGDGPSGTARLESVDTDDVWDLDLDLGRGGSATAAGDDGVATTVSGTASDLLLWAWNRLENPTTRLQIDGNADVVIRWSAMRI